MERTERGERTGRTEDVLVGVDTGGTFTDFVVLRPDGTLAVHKTLSTPDDPSRAILQGLAELGIDDALPLALVHGSTVATNAVLERKGAIVGLITTAGFRDVLEIGRQARPKLYDLGVRLVPPLVPRALRQEVGERLDERGQVLLPLDETSLTSALDALCAGGAESVAVCLLFSYANPAHEHRVAAAARAAGFHVSASADVLPEFREYERTSTVVLNAYVAPLMDRYLARLEAALPPATTLRIMQSNGGSISAAVARGEAARTLLSGPAAGVVGAAAVAGASGFDHAISFDIGGTSTDVALIAGTIAETSEGSIGGYPMRLPMIDIHTVGAGGGSIAWFDTGGALRVGPRSAGADPGPAAYGRGGEESTVTDAQVVLGRLLPDAFLGGTLRLDAASARRAVERVSARLGSSVEAAALGILRVVNANMEAAIRLVSVQRGYDPRDFALVAFGGAGPLHACELAQALRIPRVLVPSTPGVLSALGMLTADIVKDYVRTVMLGADTTTSGDAATEEDATEAEERITPVFAALAGQGRRDLEGEGVAPEDIQVERYLDLRYVGQAYELVVPYVGTLSATVSAFHGAHEQRFGFSDSALPVQVVNVRVKARARVARVEGARPGQGAADAVVPATYRPVVLAGEAGPRTVEAPVYARETFVPGTRVAGPAIITQYDTTTFLPPGWSARVDGTGMLIAERDDATATPLAIEER